MHVLRIQCSCIYMTVIIVYSLPPFDQRQICLYIKGTVVNMPRNPFISFIFQCAHEKNNDIHMPPEETFMLKM